MGAWSIFPVGENLKKPRKSYVPCLTISGRPRETITQAALGLPLNGDRPKHFAAIRQLFHKNTALAPPERANEHAEQPSLRRLGPTRLGAIATSVIGQSPTPGKRPLEARPILVFLQRLPETFRCLYSDAVPNSTSALLKLCQQIA